MKITLVRIAILVSFSTQVWSQVEKLDRFTSAKKVQACFDVQMNDHTKAINEYKDRMSKNLARIEELERDKLREDVTKLIKISEKKVPQLEECTADPEKASSIDEKIKSYRNQNLALKLFFELNETNLSIIQYQDLLIKSYLKSVKLDGFGEVKLLRKFTEQEITHNKYRESLKRQNEIKESIKISAEITDCTSTFNELKKLHQKF